MSHGGGDIDFDALLQKELPPPFCAGSWRRLTAGVGVVALAILGFAVEQHFARPGPGPSGDDGAARVAPPIAISSASPALFPAAGAVGGWEGAAAPPAGGVGADVVPGGGVRYVAGARSTAFNSAAATIRPAVVGIRASHDPGVQGGIHRVGSGLIVDPRGYVVTCYHVVGSAPSITVSRFRRSGERLPARLVARQDDLALLQILGGGTFEAATLGDSNQVSVGDWVLAIGHPFGLGLTVTAGIVGRRNSRLAIPGGGQYSDVIQTDAPINEGSSGGPLVDLDGRVVGLNTAIYAPTGVFSGAGFAIPSNRIRDFVSAYLPTSPAAAGGGAMTVGRATGPQGRPPRWGLGLVSVTPTLARQLGFPTASGAVVTDVLGGSPAATAGLTVGDVLVAVDGQPVTDVAAAERVLGAVGAGRPVRLRVWRRGQSVEVVLAG